MILPIVTFALLHQVYDSSTIDATGQAQWPVRLSCLHMLFLDYMNSVHRGDQLKHHRSHEERLRGRKYPTSCIRDWQIRMRELFPPTGELSVNIMFRFNSFALYISNNCRCHHGMRLPLSS